MGGGADAHRFQREWSRPDFGWRWPVMAPEGAGVGAVALLVRDTCSRDQRVVLQHIALSARRGRHPSPTLGERGHRDLARRLSAGSLLARRACALIQPTTVPSASTS